jgi:hypothetical protein
MIRAATQTPVFHPTRRIELVLGSETAPLPLPVKIPQNGAQWMKM